MTSEITSETNPKTTLKPKATTKWRCRRCMLELNELDKYEQLKKNLMSRKTFRYMIVGREIAPETGKEHYHLYVEFNMQTVLTLKTLCNCHIDIPKTKEQGQDYCTKDCDIVEEIGEESHQGSKSVKELLKTEDPADLDPRLFKTWMNVKDWDRSMTRKDAYCPDIEVYYVWGECNAGKTKWVYDHLTDEERFDRIKCKGDFWHGVSLNKSIRIAWYDEFRDSHMHPSEFINLIDYYRNNINIKGSSLLNHYDKIFITSVQDPELIYPNMKDEEPRRQWLKRMKIIHLE